MDSLKIEIKAEQTFFKPGQIISGNVQWCCSEVPYKASIQLLWYTEGKGDEDIGLAEEMRLENLQASDSRWFEFQAPIGPYSFSGKLISLTWALELQAGKECVRKEIVISPTGNEILLSSAG